MTTTEEIKRPQLLTMMCVSTFIFSGMGAISGLTTPLLIQALTSEELRLFVIDNPVFKTLTDSDKEEMLRVLKAGSFYYLLTFLFAVGSLFGAKMMWDLKKIGFHFYALSNLSLLFVPTLLLDMPLSNGNIFFTLSFIGIYALHLRIMK